MTSPIGRARKCSMSARVPQQRVTALSIHVARLMSGTPLRKYSAARSCSSRLRSRACIASTSARSRSRISAAGSWAAAAAGMSQTRIVASVKSRKVMSQRVPGPLLTTDRVGCTSRGWQRTSIAAELQQRTLRRPQHGTSRARRDQARPVRRAARLICCDGDGLRLLEQAGIEERSRACQGTSDDEAHSRRTAGGDDDLALRVPIDTAPARQALQANDVAAGRRVVRREDADTAFDGALHAGRLNRHRERHRFDTGTAAGDADRHSARTSGRFRSDLAQAAPRRKAMRTCTNRRRDSRASIRHDTGSSRRRRARERLTRACGGREEP